MDIEFDPTKSATNEERRDLPFDLVEEFKFDSAIYAEDTRQDYGEVRNKREVTRYGNAQKP